MFSKLIIASHNTGKIKEIEALFKPFSIDVEKLSAYSSVEPEEDGETFEENALIKAKDGLSRTGFACLADDSGLCIPILGGAPGIYTAYLGGPSKNFKRAMEYLEEILKEYPHPKAFFVCVFALCLPDGRTFTYRGTCHGHLVFPGRGVGGHGFDSIFVKEGYTETFAEIPIKIKNQESARADAFRQLVDTLKVLEKG